MTNPSPLDPRIIYPELHAALGYGFLLSFRFLLPASWFWHAFAFLEIVLLVKEAAYDPATEGKTQPFFWQGVQDFAWYHVGYAIAGLFLIVLLYVPR